MFIVVLGISEGNSICQMALGTGITFPTWEKKFHIQTHTHTHTYIHTYTHMNTYTHTHTYYIVHNLSGVLTLLTITYNLLPS